MFRRIIKKEAFTLLEIIIVIVIIGVLASLALPRLFAMVEFSRSAEAWMHISTIRVAAERCILLKEGASVGCGNMRLLGLADDVNIYSTYFKYNIVSYANGYEIWGDYTEDAVSKIGVIVNHLAGTIKKCGEGVFESIGPCS